MEFTPRMNGAESASVRFESYALNTCAME
jgi:hypothetical protein